ncbi:MAG: DUF4846 domain-containing protein [Acidobacteriota bacterium]
MRCSRRDARAPSRCRARRCSSPRSRSWRSGTRFTRETGRAACRTWPFRRASSGRPCRPGASRTTCARRLSCTPGLRCFASTARRSWRGSDVAAVLDMPLLDATQQCADSALRYWFEYLHEAGKDDEIQAKLTSGEKVTLARWKADRKRGESDQEVFIRFLKHCMNYVGSYSLSRDLPSVDESDLGPGCLIVQPNPKGGIGHLSMIFDMARNARGERVFLVGYGFLPAQSVFLAKPDAGNGPAATAWFSLEGFQAQHAYLGKTFVYRRFAP